MKNNVLRISNLLLAGILCVSLADCTKVSKVSRSERVMQPAADKALVYIARPDRALSGGVNRVVIDAPVYDNDVYIGSIPQLSHMALQMDPGKHLFMVLGDKPDFVRAELLAGKIYYLKIEAWQNESRFELVANNGQFSPDSLYAWVTETAQVVANSRGRSWAASNEGKAKTLKAKYFPEWEREVARDPRFAEKHIMRAESGK